MRFSKLTQEISLLVGIQEITQVKVFKKKLLGEKATQVQIDWTAWFIFRNGVVTDIWNIVQILELLSSKVENKQKNQWRIYQTTN